MGRRSIVSRKLKQSAFYHRKHEIKRGLANTPENCSHNVDFELPSGFRLGSCGISSQTGCSGCDSRLPGSQDQVRSCMERGLYQHIIQDVEGWKESVKALWARRLTESPKSELARQGFSDIAALKWVLEAFDALEPDTSDFEALPILELGKVEMRRVVQTPFYWLLRPDDLTQASK